MHCLTFYSSPLVRMNTVSEPTVWQPLKRTMVENLNKKKVPHTLQILAEKYSDSTIITLQEVSSSFIDQAVAGPLGKKFHIIASAHMDAVRDQNSVILLCKTNFPKGMEQEISDQVSASFPDGVRVPVASGDILAITTKDQHGVPFVVASFHGDTNGLATKPVLDAVIAAMKKQPALANHHLIFGMDGMYDLLYHTRLFVHVSHTEFFIFLSQHVRECYCRKTTRRHGVGPTLCATWTHVVLGRCARSQKLHDIQRSDIFAATTQQGLPARRKTDQGRCQPQRLYSFSQEQFWRCTNLEGQYW
jgi:hypothetical protein